MKHKTLFRLLLKLLGVFFLVEAMVSASGYVLGILFLAVDRPILGGRLLTTYLAQFAPVLVKAGIGLYLFCGGRWVADKAIPGNRPYCHECGYDLTGAVGDRCTECGTPFAPAGGASST